MKVLFACVLSICLLSSSQCASVSKERILRERAEKIIANFSDYFDKLQPQIASFFQKHSLDPMDGPDVLRRFSSTDLLGTEWHGQLELTKGFVKGLSTAHRDGDAVMVYENPLLNIAVVLGFDNVAFRYDYVAKFMDIGPSGALTGKVVDLTLDLDLLINLEDMTMRMGRMEVLQAGTVSVELEGNLLDFLFNAIINLVIMAFHDTIVHVVRDAVFLEMEKMLATVNLYDIIYGLYP